MRDIDFMAQLLALEDPWKVEQVSLAPKDNSTATKAPVGTPGRRVPSPGWPK